MIRISILGGILITLSSMSARAVIVDIGTGTGNNTSTGAGAGWNYVGSVNGSSGVYLGSYGGGNWVLTANHVGGGNFAINGTTYNLVPGSGAKITGLDLYVFKITIAGGSSLLTLPNLAISSTAPTTGSSVKMIGYGRNRAAAATTWYVDLNPNPYVWSESNFVGADATVSGYKYANGTTKRWGDNTLEASAVVSGTSMLITDFDAGESTVATNDSGGGMFYLNGSTWELAGILDLKGTYSGQPGNTAVFGNASYAINLAQYRNLILAAIPEPSGYGLLFFGGLFLLIQKKKSLVG